MASSSPVETEIKLRPPDAGAARALIERSGFAVSVDRVFESNVLYDTVDAAFRQRGELVRIRTIRVATDPAAVSEAVLTFKGAAEPGKHKVRPELETRLADATPLEVVFDRAGALRAEHQGVMDGQAFKEIESVLAEARSTWK